MAGGVSGFRLDPDSYNYAGALGSMGALIALSAVSAFATVRLLPRETRWLFVAVSAWWCLFPGVDALGCVFVLYSLRARRPVVRAVFQLAALVAHPVAGMTTAPLLFRRSALALAATAALTTAAVLGVGVGDAFSTTDRYLMPLLAAYCLLSVGWAKRRPQTVATEGVFSHAG